MAADPVGRIAGSAGSIRHGWALAGVSAVVLVSIVASSNLEEIYQSQKDFVTGSLLSLAGFCFGKAFSRTYEQKALELIRGRRAPQVAEAVEEAASATLHQQGVFETLSRLERDLQAGSERISEFYDEHCRTVDRFSGMAVLRVALDDLDKAQSSTLELRDALTGSSPAPTYMIDPAVRLALVHIARDYREAIARRDQAYEWYRKRIADREHPCWDVFAVMTSDMLKGERLLSALLGRSVQSPPEEYLRMIAGYVRASIARAREVTQLVASEELGVPKVFDVMLQDLDKAISSIDDIDLDLVQSVPRTPQRPAAVNVE
jgi:hypothetical protein